MLWKRRKIKHHHQHRTEVLEVRVAYKSINFRTTLDTATELIKKNKNENK